MSASSVDEFLCDELFSDDDDDLISGKGLEAALASSRGAPISHHEVRGSVLRIHDSPDGVPVLNKAPDDLNLLCDMSQQRFDYPTPDQHATAPNF